MFGVSAGTAALIGGGLGTAATLYGANKQSKDNAAAQNQNYQQFLAKQKSDWSNYLMQRGLSPNGDVTVGQIPTNATPINTKLPLWMSVNVPRVMGAPTGATATTPRRRLVPIGTNITPSPLTGT